MSSLYMQWAGWLQQHGLPAAFRSQQNMRTRMSTHALPHKSIGVPYYMWATSPLRRYIDLANQRQIIAAAQHGVSARLVAPYQPKDPDLFAVISTFEEQYSARSEERRVGKECRECETEERCTRR